MIHFIKSGKNKVTAKNWHRLEEAEKAAGMAVNSRGANETQVACAIAAAEKRSKVNISVKDIDRGYVDVPVHYRRGDAPPKFPTNIRVTTPSTKVAARALAAIKLDEDYTSLLSACLPPQQATPEFLDRITPFSYNAILEAALVMSFGLDWKKMV